MRGVAVLTDLFELLVVGGVGEVVPSEPVVNAPGGEGESGGLRIPEFQNVGGGDPAFTEVAVDPAMARIRAVLTARRVFSASPDSVFDQLSRERPRLLAISCRSFCAVRIS